MPFRKSGLAALFAATCAAVAIGAAPMAAADECDPSVVACDSGSVADSPGNVEINDSPPASSVDQYPSDDEWYFNPSGGGTALQPSGGSHGGGGGGGGGHR